MKENETIIKRQAFNLRFKNGDMDFMLNWAIGIGQIIGLSTTQVFYAVHGIKDGDPKGWCNGFVRLAEFQIHQAEAFVQSSQAVAAGEAYLGAAYAYRSAIQYTNPFTPEFTERITKMEQAFQSGIRQLGIPMRPIEVPYAGTTLPGYFLEHDASPHPLILMVGGGDTFREDLFYFAGYPGWKRGYNVLMVDLPGQGITPNRGLHFQVDMAEPISTILSWLETQAAVKPQHIAIYGVSGGGYFTAQAVAHDPRIEAWIAATPIFDVAEEFRTEFGVAMKAPGWLVNSFMRLVGAFNVSAEINLAKYAWQFGVSDFKYASEQVIIQAKNVDYTTISCPSLFLMSEGETPGLIKQTQTVYNNFIERGIDVNLQKFSAAQGADAHCELNNLRLTHLIIFDWLDQLFGHDSGDIRLRC